MNTDPNYIVKRAVIFPTLKEYLEENDMLVTEIDSLRNYWFIRTQGGSYFDEFFFNGFVAIGWDDVPCMPESERTETILQDVQSKGYGIPNRVMNQVLRFCTSVKIGDVVIIPSESSAAFAFGLIESDVYEVKPTQEDIDAENCLYTRRRKVKWILDVPKERIDPKLFAFFRNQQALSSANDCAEFIDRAICPFYIKDNIAHLTLSVEAEKSPRADDIPSYMHGILSRSFELAEELGLLPITEDDDEKTICSGDTSDSVYSPYSCESSDSSTSDDSDSDEEDELIRSRINVQSPGIIELLGDPSFVFLTGIVVIFLCGGKVRFKADEKTTNIDISTGGLPYLIDTISKIMQRHKKDRYIGEEKMSKIQSRLKLKDPRTKK